MVTEFIVAVVEKLLIVPIRYLEPLSLAASHVFDAYVPVFDPAALEGFDQSVYDAAVLEERFPCEPVLMTLPAY